MKGSPPPLRSLAAAATAAGDPVAITTRSTANMSIRPTYRDGRNQWRSKGFCDRPYDGPDNDQFVSGDSHFQAVRDSNRGFRPVERGNIRNQGPYPPNYSRVRPPFGHRPNFNQNQPLNPPAPLHSNQNQRFRAPGPPQYQPLPSLGSGAPHFHQNQQFRPPRQFQPRPSRASDYRNWEYAKPGPPSYCERFTVLSYNILADYLALNHRNQLYFHIPHYMLDWEFRMRNIISELGWWSADILCFQEVDRFHDLENELKVQGYSGIWKMRTGDPVDGCAIFWRESRFKLLHEEFIEFNKLGLRDNVAQICVLESMSQSNNRFAPALPESAPGANKVVICNIHVLYNPKRGEIKLGQVRVLLDRAHAVSKLWDNAPVVVCGDFNCTPKSAVYNFISEQKLNVSELPRDKLSGQASAEIRPPRAYNPSPRPPCGSPASVDPKEVKENDFPPDMQNMSSSHISLENISCMSSVDQSQSKNITHQQGKGKDEMELPSNPQVCGSEESPSSSNDIASSSHRRISHPDIETQSREETYTTSAGSYDLSRRLAQANLSAENEISNSEMGVSDNYSADATVRDMPVSATNLNATLCQPLDVSSTNIIENSSPETSENLLSLSVTYAKDEVDISNRYKHAAVAVDEVMEKLSCIEVGEATENESLVEDTAALISELQNTDVHLPTDLTATSSSMDCSEPIEKSVVIPEVLDNLSGIDQEPFNGERTPYDPSAWTPMEIENATGSSECTFMEHHMKLRSTYCEVEDLSGTRDSNGEPQVTSYHRRFSGTVDYTWRSEGLQTVRVRAPIQKQAMQWTPGFPTKKWGSDHIALVTELAFTNDDSIQDSEVQ